MKFVSVTKRSFSEFNRREATDLDEDASAVRRNEDFRGKYYAFTSMDFEPKRGLLFCGTTNFSDDLLHAYNPAQAGGRSADGGVAPAPGQFESMGYREIGEKYEVKIHRGLCIGDDGCVYAATSCLHGINELAKGPGGKVFRFDPATRSYEVLSVPIPQLYIQTISLDWDRQMIYGMAYPVFEFFALSLKTGEVVYRQFMGSIAHIAAVDDAGGYWGTWLGKGRQHNLFRYDPAGNEVRFFEHGFPTPCRSLMYYLAGPIDAMINGGDGFLYIGHESGELYRLDPTSGELTYLCKPLPGARMPGLAVGEDGLLFGVGGPDRRTAGFVYDRKSGQCEVLGPIRDEQADADCFRTHDCCLIGDRLFVGETDNPDRSCYLWECQLG